MNNNHLERDINFLDYYDDENTRIKFITKVTNKKEPTEKEKKETSILGCFFTKEEMKEKEKLNNKKSGMLEVEEMFQDYFLNY